jgi:hypothetical protein
MYTARELNELRAIEADIHAGRITEADGTSLEEHMDTMKKKRMATPQGVRARAPKEIWVLFDISNGLDGSKNYVWWFETRAKARGYKLEIERRMREGERHRLAELVGPHRYRYVKDRPTKKKPARR